MVFQLPLPDALLGALVGAIAGSLGTFVVKEHIRKKRKKERADRVRTALLSEIEVVVKMAVNVDEHIQEDEYIRTEKRAFQILDSLVHKDLYSSNSSDIALLTEEEIEEIVIFYTRLNRFDIFSSDELDDDDDVTEMISDILSRVIVSGNRCVNILESNK